MQPFADLSPDEAERFMAGNRHPMREVAAEAVGGRQVIDLGCGRGLRVKDLYSRSQYIGIDISPTLIAIARRDNPGFTFEVGSIVGYLTPLPDQCFETAVMISVLEHVPSLAAAQAIYREARRTARELFVGWHTPPRFAKTEILQVNAELNRPIWQNHYAAGTFDGAVDVRRVQNAELWTVRH